jgi:hypothetical protein
MYDRALQAAVNAQEQLLAANTTVAAVKNEHWDLLSSSTYEKRLKDGCLYEKHGPLKMNETLQGDIMSVTLIRKHYGML